MCNAENVISAGEEFCVAFSALGLSEGGVPEPTRSRHRGNE